MPLWTAVRPDTRPRPPTPPLSTADRRSTTVVYPSPPPLRTGSPLAAAQPNYQTAHQQHGRQSQQKAEADHARLQWREHETSVARGLSGNGDQLYINAQPIKKKQTKNEIADVAEIAVGKKIAVADHHHALLLHGGAGDVFRGGRRAVKIDANSDRTAEVFIFIELHLAAERPGLHPTAAAGLQ